MPLPSDAADRKATPIYSGVMKYFPDALAEVARVSKAGNDQHNPGEPLHWAKEKSSDEGDALVRHQLEAGGFDSDGMRHSAKVAWRALAQLQRELDAEAEDQADPVVLDSDLVTPMAYGQYIELGPNESLGEALDRLVQH